MDSSFWKPSVLDSASEMESTPPVMAPEAAQAECNFIVWVPHETPAGCRLASPTLRREAPPGASKSIARTPWSENNPSAYRYEIEGAGRRLRIKQFHYDWAFPALDHPCLWESATRAAPLTGPYVLWFGADYMGNPAASIRLARTMIEISVLAGVFSEKEILAMVRSMRPASAEAAEIIRNTPFKELSYSARHPAATTVDVPIGMWSFRRGNGPYEGKWTADEADMKALLSELRLPTALGGFRIDSAARFINNAGLSEVEALYTTGSDRGQELRLIAQKSNQGRIEFPAVPEEEHPCSRSIVQIGGVEAAFAWIDERYGPFDVCWRDTIAGLDFKLLSTTGIGMDRTWILGAAEELTALVR